MTADEMMQLLRFQRLDARNGALSGEPDAIRLCGAAADMIERLDREKDEYALLAAQRNVNIALIADERDRLRAALECLLPGLVLDLRYADDDDDKDALRSRVETVQGALTR